MTQAIDSVKLKAAAEHLEWVCKQYPGIVVVQDLYEALLPLIEDAKAERVRTPVEKIPCGYLFGDGLYESYKSPNVDEAYVNFSTEMKGGLSEEEKELLSDTESLQKEILGRVNHRK
ncbi:hypothetical protein V9K97_03175 [Variovorax sp. CCNWLW186]|uniref:hypothetical protein n=1 Tax=Variovorax sp. CCNWLW186 TaxID=3127473 RepID=UPI0030775737